MVAARGHGLTDPPTPGDSSNAMVKDLVEFTEKMKLVKPILMDHSMGAATVVRIGGLSTIGKSDYYARCWIGCPPGSTSSTSSHSTRPNPALANPAPAASGKNPTVSMGGTPEVLVAQNNYS